MIVLLDAHLLVWAIFEPQKVSPQAVAILQDPANHLIVGQSTIWELLAKAGRGKLRFPGATVDFLFDQVMKLGITWLPITLNQILLSVHLPHHHSDPFDRLLIAQAMTEKLAVVTADRMFNNYDIDVIWD